MLVSAPYEANKIGALYIYRYQNNEWELFDKKKGSEINSLFGFDFDAV